MKPKQELIEMLKTWDEGHSVWSIEMGGLGPGYEQAIQLLVIQLIRDNLDKPLPSPKKANETNWGDDTVHRISEAVYGFSGAQVGAAKQVAYRFLRDGVKKTLDSIPQDRKIQVSKDFPHLPEVRETAASIP